MRVLKKQFLYAALGLALISLSQKTHATEFATFHLVDKVSGKEIRRLTTNDKVLINKNLAIEARVNNLSVDKVRFESNCGSSFITDDKKPFRVNLDSLGLSNSISCKIVINGWSNPWKWRGKEILSLDFLKTVNSVTTAKTFHVSNGKIYDANGKKFIPIGVNSVHAWLDEKNMRHALAHEIKKSGANAVRLVTSGEAWTWTSQSTSSQKKRELIQMVVNAGMVPIIELHDGTCETSYDKAPKNGKMGLKQIVDHWLKPDNVKLLKDYERYLILNIANEWGSNSPAWRDGYKKAIERLRSAGIQNLLLIDAGGNCGQNPHSILTWGQELLKHDPLHNVAFSIHMYGLWTTSDKPHNSSWQFKVEDYLKKFKDSGLAIVVGEFAWEGSETVSYNPRILVQKANEYDIGWLSWAWYSDLGKPYYNLVNNTSYNFNSDADLSDAGKFLVNEPHNGMKAKAKKASIFR